MKDLQSVPAVAKGFADIGKPRKCDNITTVVKPQSEFLVKAFIES